MLGDYQQSIVVVRSLARAGHRVIVGQQSRRAFSSLSRYAHETWTHPDAAEPARFVAAVSALLAQRAGITGIFPVGESELTALRGAHTTLAKSARLAMPVPAVVAACLDKPHTYQLAAELDVPVAPTVVVTSDGQLRACAGSIGLPLIIKCPDSSRLLNDRKAVIWRRESDLRDVQAIVSSADYPLVVQRLMDGARHNCHFAAADGTVTAYFEQRVLRTDEPDGTGFGVEGVSVPPSPALRRHCAALARRLEYHGVGCAQFLVDDRSRTHVFLELNPRLDATCELPYRCGLDLPRLALDPGRGAPADYAIGRRFHFLLGDARGVMRQVKRRNPNRRGLGAALRQLAVSHGRAHQRLTWDWADPVPTLYLYGHALAMVGRNVLNVVGGATRHR